MYFLSFEFIRQNTHSRAHVRTQTYTYVSDLVSKVEGDLQNTNQLIIIY